MAPETSFLRGHKRPRTAVEAPQQNRALRHRRKRWNIVGANGDHGSDKTNTYARRAPQGGIGEIDMCDGNLTTVATVTTPTSGRISGNMFDVKTRWNRLFVDGIDIHSDASHIGYEVYTRPGSFEGGQFGIDGWVLVERGSIKLHGEVAPIRWENAVEIGEMSVQAFYVSLTTQNLLYHDDSSLRIGAAAVGNEKLDINIGVGVSYPLGQATTYGVLFTGTLYYRAEGTCPSDMEFGTGSASVVEAISVKDVVESLSSEMPLPMSQTPNSPLASNETPSTRFESIEPSSNRNATAARPSISTTSEPPFSSGVNVSLRLSQRAPALEPSQQAIATGNPTSVIDVQSRASARIPPHRSSRIASPLNEASASSSKKGEVTPSGNPTSPTVSPRVYPDPTLEPTSLRDFPMPVMTFAPDVVQVPSLGGQSGVPLSSRAEMRTLNPIICDILPELCVPTSFPSIASQTESPSDSPAVVTLQPSENIDSRPVNRRTQTPIVEPLAPSVPPGVTDFNPTVCILIPALCAPTFSPSNALPMPASDPESTPSGILSPSPMAESARTKAPTPDPRSPSVPPTESAISPSVCLLIPALCAPTVSPSLASPTFGVTKMPSAGLPSLIIAPRPSAPPLARTKVPTLDPDQPPISPTDSTSNPSLCILIPDLCAPSIAAPTLSPSFVGTEEPTLGSGPAPSSAPTFGRTEIPSLIAGLPSVSPAESHSSPAVCLLIPALCAPTGSPSISEPRPSGTTGKTRVPTLDAGVSSPTIVTSKSPTFGKTKSPTLAIGPTMSPSAASPESVPTLGRTKGPTLDPRFPSPVILISPSAPIRQRTKVPTLNAVPTSPSRPTLNPSVCVLIPELCAPFPSPTSSNSPSRSKTRDPTPRTPSPLMETTDKPVLCTLVPELCAPAAAPRTPIPSTIPPSPESRPSVTRMPSRSVTPSGSVLSPAMSQSAMPSVDPSDTINNMSPPSGSSWPSEAPSSVPSETLSGSSLPLSPSPETPPGSSWPSETPSSVPSERPSVYSWASGTPSSFPPETPSGSSWPSAIPSLSPRETPSGSSWLSGNPSLLSLETPSGSSWPSEIPSSIPSGKPSGSSLPSGNPSSVSPVTLSGSSSRPSSVLSQTPSGSSLPSSIPSSVQLQTPSGSSWPSETPSSVPAESPSGSSWPSEFPSSSPSEPPVSDTLLPISCPGFVRGQNGTAEQIIDFSYRVETSSSKSNFLSEVESAVLLEVSKLVLACQDVTGNGRWLQTNDERRIYQVGYPESGALSATTPCTPTEPSARYCFDVGTQLAVISDNGDESAVRAKVEQAISDVFIDSEGIEKQVPGATVYQVDGSGPTSSPVSDTGSTSGPSPLVISLSVVLGIIVLVAAWLLYRRRQKKRPKRGNMTTPEPFVNDDDDLSINLVDKYNSQNGDPDDDYSRYGYESAVEPLSENHDEYRSLIGSSPDEHRDDEQRVSGAAIATTYEDDDVKMTADDGNVDANDDLVWHRDNSAPELMRDEMLRVTKDGVATGYIDEDTAISIGSDLTDNHGYSASDNKYASAISMAQVFDDADALGEAEATAFAMTSTSSVTDLAVVRSLLLLPIVKILFGNPSEYVTHVRDKDELPLRQENAPYEGRQSIGFSVATKQIYDDPQDVEARERRSPVDIAPDHDEKGIDRQHNHGLRDESSEYGSESSPKLFSEYDNLEGDPLPIVATFGEGDGLYARNLDENEIIQDDIEGTSQPGDSQDANEGGYPVNDHNENESLGSLDEGRSYSTGGEGANANNGNSFVVVEESALRMDYDAKGFVTGVLYDESDQGGVNYNESEKSDPTSYKGNDAHSMTSYEENIAMESSNLGNFDDVGSRSGRQYYYDEPEDLYDHHRNKYDDEDMDSRQGSHFDDSHHSEIDDQHNWVSRQGGRFHDDHRHQSDIDDDLGRVPLRGSHFNDDSHHSENNWVPQQGSRFTDDSRYGEIDDDHYRVSGQGSQFNDDSCHSGIDYDHDGASIHGSDYYDYDSRHGEVDVDQEMDARPGSQYDDDSRHSDIDD